MVGHEQVSARSFNVEKKRLTHELLLWNVRTEKDAGERARRCWLE